MNTMFTHRQIYPSSAQAWSICLVAALFFWYEFLQMNMLNTIAPALLEAFNISPKRLGFFSSSFFYANALFLLPAGVLLDRYSIRKLILIAMLSCILGTLMLAVATELLLAEIGRFIVGFSNSFAFLGCMKLATRWFPPQRIAMIVGVIVTMGMLGGMVAQTPLAFLINCVGWRQALFIDVSVGIIIFLMIFYIVHDYPEGFQNPHASHSIPPRFYQKFKSAVFSRKSWVVGIYIGFVNLPLTILGALWGSLYLTKVQNITMVDASVATSFLFGGMIIGSPFIGWISDISKNRKIPMLLTALFLSISIIPIIYDVQLSFINIIIYFFLIGFLSSGQVIGFSYIAENTPLEITSSILGLMSVIIMLCTAIFQPLFGWIVESNLNFSFMMKQGFSHYQYALMLLPATAFISFMLTTTLREDKNGK